MRPRAANYSRRGEKCAQYPQLSIATSDSLKQAVLTRACDLDLSVSAYVRSLIEKDLLLAIEAMEKRALQAIAKIKKDS